MLSFLNEINLQKNYDFLQPTEVLQLMYYFS